MGLLEMGGREERKLLLGRWLLLILLRRKLLVLRSLLLILRRYCWLEYWVVDQVSWDHGSVGLGGVALGGVTMRGVALGGVGLVSVAGVNGLTRQEGLEMTGQDVALYEVNLWLLYLPSIGVDRLYGWVYGEGLVLVGEGLRGDGGTGGGLKGEALQASTSIPNAIDFFPIL